MSSAAPVAKGSGRLQGDAFVHHLNTNLHGLSMVKILPGGHYVTRDPNEMLVTVLGSCVSACIRDPLTGFGGMNHFMLPDGPKLDDAGASNAMRYGSHAMEVLINKVLASGCARRPARI